jgi:hypothetical protein
MVKAYGKLLPGGMFAWQADPRGVGRFMARFQSLWFWVAAGGTLAVLLALGVFWLVRAGRHDALPPIAAGIAFGAASSHPNVEFTNRLLSRFPLGSDAAALSGELDHEGFTVDAAHGKANIKSGKGWPCLEILEVDWKADTRNRIASLDGYYFSACL